MAWSRLVKISFLNSFEEDYIFCKFDEIIQSQVENGKLSGWFVGDVSLDLFQIWNFIVKYLLVNKYPGEVPSLA